MGIGIKRLKFQVFQRISKPRIPGLPFASLWANEPDQRRETVTMTDLMNLAFLLITFGAGIAFVLACERLK